MMAPGAVAVAAEDRNRAPERVGALDDLTLLAGAAAVTIDGARVFSDPDDDKLTYTVHSSHPARLAVTLSGSRMRLAPQAPGRVRVTVRATDPGGFRTKQTFSVAVTAGNRDYDLDDDNLIEVGDLAQLDAMRYGLDGDGLVDGTIWRPYYEAFPEGALQMGCPDGCTGYELTADLDFDTNGSGRADAGDANWVEASWRIPCLDGLWKFRHELLQSVHSPLRYSLGTSDRI